MNDPDPSPEKLPRQLRREKRLAEALRANLKRRKAAVRKVSEDEPATSVGRTPGEELPGDERG